MKPFRCSGNPVQSCFLCTGQDAIAVFDGPGHDGKAMGFEFWQADQNIGVQDFFGDPDFGHEIRIKGQVLGCVAEILIVALCRSHQSGFFKAFFIVAIVEQAGIVPHHNLGRGQGFHFVDNRPQ